MIKPNIGRVIVKPLKHSDKLSSGGIIMPGQLKAGENLLIGVIVVPGTNFQGEPTKLKKGQLVYYSEYSAAGVVDMADFIEGKTTFADSEKYVVIAEDDIMAYETRDIEIKEEDLKKKEEPKKVEEKEDDSEEVSIITEKD